MGFKVDFSHLDWGASENKLRGRPDDLEYVVRALEHVATTLGGRMCTSHRGRPYIVLSRESVTYSIGLFSSGVWSVSFPFPSWGGQEERLRFIRAEEVIEYFDKR